MTSAVAASTGSTLPPRSNGKPQTDETPRSASDLRATGVAFEPVHPVLTRRALWLLLGVATPLATALAIAALWPVWSAEPTLALVLTLLFATLLSIGLVLLNEPGQTGPGVAVVAAAPGLILSWSDDWGGPFPYLSTVFSYPWLIALGWALFRYPSRRLERIDRTLWLIASIWLGIMPFVGACVSIPEWHEFPPNSWWLTLDANYTLFRWVDTVTNVGIFAVVVAIVVRWILLLRSARPAERRAKAPIALASAVAIGMGGLVRAAAALQMPDSVMDALYSISVLAFVAIPVAFLVAVLRRQLAHTRLSELVLKLRAQPTTDEITQALREALEDPGLTIRYWSDQANSYLDEERKPYRPPTGTDPLVIDARTTTGEPLALVIADDALHRDPDLVRACVTAFSFSLENARLLEEVRHQYADLQAASERVVKAADTERRALEQDLHDGVLQEFLALAPLIGVAEARTSDELALDTLVEMRARLRHALAELRDVSHGLHPGALRMGLPAAVRSLGRNHAVALQVDLPETTMSSSAELTAYYTISEAITNASTHGHATRITVGGHIDNGWLTVEVRDDGCGGARPGSGHGLANIRDRVTALGGRWSVTSPPGRGTVVRMAIPCE